MDPMTIIALVGLIIGTITGVDQSIAQGLAHDRNHAITKEATTVLNQIAKDRDLLTRLIDAYNKRDIALANQMLQSSPFGNRLRVLKEAYKKNQQDTNKAIKQLGDLETTSSIISNQISEKQAKHSQTSGSTIIDLVSGAAKDPTKTDKIEYKPIGIKDSTIQEVNYGQK